MLLNVVLYVWINLPWSYLTCTYLDAVWNTRVLGVYLQTERQQRQQGLFGGLGRELWQRLDELVHHRAKVTLQLLPPLLHKLGVLKRERERERELSSAALSH